MTADVGAPTATGLARVRSELWEIAVEPVRRLPSRLRDPRFWHIQAMVALATLPHYVIEAAGFTNPFETFHGLAITLYVIPLLYAAINYGWEGAVLTGLWAAMLTSPSMWIWHRSEYHWFSELGQLAITLPVGFLVAWRVEKETEQRRRAETTSARLALLNEIGESLSHTLEVERQLPIVLQMLREGLSLEAVWLCLEPTSGEGPPEVLVEQSKAGAPALEEAALDQHRRVRLAREGAVVHERTAVIPLLGESGFLGSVGALAAGRQTMAEEQVDLLATVAHEIRVAVENARLYRERQESMRSYVRQVTQAQEDERLRIARELHDETAQELVLLVRKLEQLGAEAGPELPASVEQLLGMARETLRSVRRFSRDLRPPVLDDLGLLAAIEATVEDADHQLPGGAKLTVSGSPRRLDGATELALFRIAQEALRNVEKHAGASSATVSLEFDPKQLRLSVSDDGSGFSLPRNVPDFARRGKLGLLGMKERAELVSGSLELRSAPGEGTEVVVTVGAT